MDRHIEVARAFVDEQLQARADIIAALLVGSAASGETTAFSDVDLRLIVEGRHESKLQREGIDRWEEGIYVDATFAAAADYADVDGVLSDRGSADTMNFGHILHDPTGRFATLQATVQARYLEPRWLAVRVDPMRKLIAERLPALRQAVDDGDALYIHIHAGRVLAGLGFIPLLQRGVAVSSSRSMMQLVRHDPAYAQRLMEVESAALLSQEQVLAALDVFAALSEIDPHQEYATLAGYMVGKARWMARNGYAREAVHTGWLHSGNRASGCALAGDEDLAAKARALSAQWLAAVGWVGHRVLQARVEALAAIGDEVGANIASA